MENLAGVACNCRMISGQSFTSASNISCSISRINNANHGVVAVAAEKNPFCCDPLKNGINVEETLDFGSLCCCERIKQIKTNEKNFRNR